MINSRFKQIIKSNRPVLVHFHAEWCRPCHQLLPVLKSVKNRFKEKIRITKVNVDSNRYIASRFQVKNLPTLILFRSGEVKWTNEGMIGEGELIGILKKYVLGKEES